MSSEKTEEEDSPASKIALMDQHKNSSAALKRTKERLITEANKITESIRTNRATKTRKQKCEEKQLCRYFKRQTGEISHENTWIWLWKGNLKKEAESLLTAAQNNAMRTNYLCENRQYAAEQHVYIMWWWRRNDESHNNVANWRNGSIRLDMAER